MHVLRRSILTASALVLAVTGFWPLSGAGAADWLRLPFTRQTRSQSPDDDAPAPARATTSVDTPLIGEKTTVSGLNPIILQGVGLVTGLDGTGEDPPPSIYRDTIMDEMRRRNINNRLEILASPNTAIVLVRAYLPPLVRQGEHFDIEVSVPENSLTTSLNGGWLLETYLTEHALVPGQGILKGHVYAKAAGPILVSTGEGDEESRVGRLKRGRILGGGVAIKQRDLVLNVRSDFATIRNAMQIADQIGDRFYDYNKYGLREPLAEAKTNQRIELKLMPRYKDNYPRYLQVIRHLPFRETIVARQVRMQRLKDELNVPATAERAALELEAIGFDAVPILKTGLKNSSLEVRFQAGTALAYLGEAAGVESLAEAAREEPAFRIHAFAALAAVDAAEAHMALRNLLGEESAETRYGAWRALTTMDPDDPFVRGETLNDEFTLHAINVPGPPMVHLTRRNQAEIVLFGAVQRFHMPLAIRAGSHVLVSGQPGADSVVVSRYEVGKPDQRQVVSTSIADVIRAAAELGATYPDIAGMLVQAERQRNLPGRLELDALPAAGRVYVRPDADVGTGPAGSPRRTRVGHRNQTPNLFGTPGDDTNNRDETPAGDDARTRSGDEGTASSVDISQPADKDTTAADKASPAAEEDPPSQGGFDPFKIFRR
jgi:hypothetical protein